MKCAVQLLKLACMAMLCGLLMLSCDKNPDGPEDPTGNPGDSTNVDTISNHLQFTGATKNPGTIPAGPAVSSLKISVKDTIYLMDKVKRSIKFLHTDTTKNVAGIYLQVHQSIAGGTGSTFATYYYDVPEVPDMAENDTVSVIMIGIDPAGLEAPLIFDVTITPYDKNHQPIAKAIRPVRLELKADPGSTTGPCGLVLPPDDIWVWEMSYKENASGQFTFYNDPKKVWGMLGQNIKGSCCNGNSVYGICPGDSVPNSVLHFNTIFMYLSETFKFLDDGTFARFTVQFNNNPAPNESNFCGTNPGVVHETRNEISYAGNWTLDPATKNLRLQTTSSTGFGYGNPGGIIHQLDCNLLVMIQPDLEGGQPLYKFYDRMSATSSTWYPFP